MGEVIELKPRAKRPDKPPVAFDFALEFGLTAEAAQKIVSHLCQKTDQEWIEFFGGKPKEAPVVDIPPAGGLTVEMAREICDEIDRKIEQRWGGRK